MQTVPADVTADSKDRQSKKDDDGRDYASRQLRSPVDRRWWRLLSGLLPVGEIVLGKKLFFIEPEIAGYGAHEAAIKDPAGKPVPGFILKCFKETRADAGGRSDFVERNLAHLTFAPQPFAEIPPSHCDERSIPYERPRVSLPGNIGAREREVKE